jgi:hypothetical protein
MKNKRKLYKVEGMQAHRDFLKKEILAVDGWIEEAGYTNGSTTFAYLVDLLVSSAKKLANDGWTVEEWREV